MISDKTCRHGFKLWLAVAVLSLAVGQVLADPEGVDDPDLERWQRLQRLVELDARQWATLEYLLQQESGAGTDNGTLDVAIGETDPAEDPTPQSIDLWTLYNSILGVRNVVNSISARVPNKPDVRELVDKVSLASTNDLLDILRDEVGGIIESARELREGFADWQAASCNTRSLCRFREEVSLVLGDLADSWEAVQRLSCVDDPSLEIRPLQGFEEDGLLRTLLLERLPKVVLYGMQRALDLTPGWETSLRELLDRVPPPLTQFCEEGAESPAVSSSLAARSSLRDRRKAPLNHTMAESTSAAADAAECLPSPFPGSIRCCELRKPLVKEQLQSLHVRARLTQLIFEKLENISTDSKTVTAGATAVAGATGGTNVKNPINLSAKTVKNVLEKLEKVSEKLLEMRTKCLESDVALEHDLADCTAIAGYTRGYAEGGRFEELADLVERRIDELCCETCCPLARDELDAAAENQDYPALCAAYDRLGAEQ